MMKLWTLQPEDVAQMCAEGESYRCQAEKSEHLFFQGEVDEDFTRWMRECSTRYTCPGLTT